MTDRYYVRRESLEERVEGGPGWLVVDQETGETLHRFTRRTNWVDGEPYGPEAAADETVRRLNDPLPASPEDVSTEPRNKEEA